MGTADRIFRISFALIIAGLFYLNIIHGTLAIVLIIISSVLVITSIVSFCPIYLLFGISTRKKLNN